MRLVGVRLVGGERFIINKQHNKGNMIFVFRVVVTGLQQITD